MTAITDIPHSPLPNPGQWPQSFLDDIHLWLANAAGQGWQSNVLINGEFDVAQRTGPAAANPGAGVTSFVADRWRLARGVGANIASQAYIIGAGANYNTFLSPFLPRSSLKLTITAAVNASILSQRIESVNTLAGQTATLAFYALWSDSAGSADLPFAAELVQNFGTGAGANAPITTPITTFNLVHNGNTNLSTRSAWSFTVPSIVGKGIGASLNPADDYLELRFTLPAGRVGTLELIAIDLRASAFALPYLPTPLDITFQRCRRFYRKSYDYNAVPGTAATFKGALNVRAVNSPSLAFPGAFSEGMRGQPALTLYSPNSGTANRIYNAVTLADMTVNATDPSEETWGIVTLSAAPAANDLLRMQYTADAEL